MLSNQFISRDEGMHCTFAALCYELVERKLNKEIVHNIFKEAVDISKIFVRDAIQCDMIGMNLVLMNEYIEYVADYILVMLKYDKLYFTTNPFPFMETIGIFNKSNFFEKRPTDYSSATSTTNHVKNHISLIEDF